MRKWGIVISAFYALVLLALIVPGTAFFVGKFHGWPNFLDDLVETYRTWLFWIPTGAILISQALLLFLSVDASQKRLKPRAHILVSTSVAAVLTALLTSGVIWSLGVVIRGDKFGGSFFDRETNIVGFWGAIWVFWGIVFYLYFRNSSAVVSRIISW